MHLLMLSGRDGEGPVKVGYLNLMRFFWQMSHCRTFVDGQELLNIIENLLESPH